MTDPMPAIYSILGMEEGPLRRFTAGTITRWGKSRHILYDHLNDNTAGFVSYEGAKLAATRANANPDYAKHFIWRTPDGKEL